METSLATIMFSFFALHLVGGIPRNIGGFRRKAHGKGAFSRPAMVARMSGLRTRGSAMVSLVFLILSPARLSGRNPPPLRWQRTGRSLQHRLSEAASISLAVCTGRTSTLSGAGRDTGPLTSTTRAPARSAARAMA